MPCGTGTGTEVGYPLPLTADAIPDVIVATGKTIKGAHQTVDTARDARIAALEPRVLELEAKQAIETSQDL